MHFENSLSFAKSLDSGDSLKEFRSQFYIPELNGRQCIYFTGNSLGLQPKGVEAAIKQELEDWKQLGVEAHFHGKNPWFKYHHFLTEDSSKIVGAKPLEVVVMNQLTTNLHLLFISFYRPVPNRYKIIMEAGAFPSDMYMVESQVKLHGYLPEDAIIEVKPRENEHHIRHEDIIGIIEQHKDTVALVFFSGVQYYTGQVFDIQKITEKAHEIGAVAGFDLAHAAGNIELKLNEWRVDFAAWCSYKYLNSGPGSVGGVYINERFADDDTLPRLAGWWGHQEDERFKMLKGFKPSIGADGWQLSNAPVLSMAAHKTSLKLFSEAGMKNVVEKGRQLNAYLQFIIENAIRVNTKLELQIITPPAPARGCQISLLTGDNGKSLFDYLTSKGVVADWRNPNVIRIAPVPLYNSFEDIYQFGVILESF
jgi:kynureninase